MEAATETSVFKHIDRGGPAPSTRGDDGVMSVRLTVRNQKESLEVHSVDCSLRRFVSMHAFHTHISAVG